MYIYIISEVMELRVSEPRTRIIRGLYDIRGGRN